MRISMTLRTRIAVAFSALSVLAVAGSVHAQFSPPTCVPPNCSPEVIQNIAVSGTAQSASINITGSGKMGGTFQTGALAPVLTAASDNLLYGNVGGTSTNGSLLLLQFGSADRLRVTLAGQMQIPIGTLSAPAYSFIGDTNTGMSSFTGDSISFVTNGVNRTTINNAGTTINSGVFSVPTGAVGTPSITFTGDTNTGIFRGGVDTLNLVTTGVSRIIIDSTGLVTIPGGLTVNGVFTAAGGIGGDGSALTNLNASNITSGTLNDARLSTNVPLENGTQTFTGVNTFSNAGNSFTGNGAGLTSLNASNISSGTLNDARLSANVALLDRANQTFTGNNSFNGMVTAGSAALPVIGAQNLIYGNVDTTSTGALLLLQNESVDRFRVAANGDVTATSFSGVGTNLTALNATNLTSGTVPSARISGTYANSLTFSNRTNFGSATLNVAGGTHLIYGNVDTASAGNLLLLQNESVDRFRVDAAGNVTAAGSLTVTGSITAGGSALCQQNGTNCPPDAVTSVSGSGAGISVAPTTGGVVVSNTGVTSLIAGAGIGLSGPTGAVTVSSTGLTGAGTTNYVSKFTSASALGNSLIRDDGTSVAIGNTPAANTMLVVGPTSQPIGFTATTNAANGVGVYGFGLGSTSIGVYGQGTGAGTVGVGGGVNGVGVQGSGQYAGVTGAGTGGSSSVGVQGSGPNGVYGIASDVWGYGVRGVAAPNSWVHGVLGTSSSNQFNSAGVAGISSNNAMGGYFQTNTAGVYALMAYNGSGGNAFQAQGTSSFTGAVTMNSTLAVTGNITVAGVNVCRQNGTNCPPATEADTLATVTSRGSTTMTTIGVGAFASGSAAITATGSSYALWGQAGAGGTAVYAYGGATGGNFQGSSIGAYGAGATYGIEGLGGGNNSYGVYGHSSYTGSYGGVFQGVYIGVYGTGSTWALYGAGNANVTGQMAVGGASVSSVYGISAAGSAAGGYFYDTGGSGSTARLGYGYYGVYAHGSGAGVYADNNSSAYGYLAYGRYGGYMASYGSSGTTNYGVYGYASSGTSNNAGYFYASGADAWGVTIAAGNARKPLGGSWSVYSDARTKKDVSDFTDGLDLVLKMRPVNFTYNGLGETPEGAKGIGFIAQEAEKVAPYLVTKSLLKLHSDDEETTEMYQLDPSALPFINMNAVKQLHLRIEGFAAKFDKVDELDMKLRKLEDRVKELESEVEALKK